MNKLIASIIIPSYNNDHLLARCLNSLDISILSDLEIIVVDDGSSKNQKEFIPTKFLKAKNFHFYRKQNGGLSSSRNYGLKKAKGEFIIFIDGDDFVDYKKMILFIEFLKNNNHKNLNLIRCGLKRIKKTKTKIYSCKKIRYFDNISKYIKKAFLHGNSFTFSSCTHVFKREFMLNNKLLFIEGILAEDLELLTRAINLIKKVAIWNNWYYIYDNTNENSYMNSKIDQMNQDICNFLDLKKINYWRFKVFLAIWYFIKIRSKKCKIKGMWFYLFISPFAFI